MVTGEHGKPGHLAVRPVVVAFKTEPDYVTTLHLRMVGVMVLQMLEVQNFAPLTQR